MLLVPATLIPDKGQLSRCFFVFAGGEGGKWGFELDAAAFRFSNTPVTAQRVELPYRCRGNGVFLIRMA